MTDLDVKECRRWAAFYRARGFNPLPSRPDAKRPMIRFRRYWEEPLPAEVFDRCRTSNIQVMTGRRWGLLVIDLDGGEAVERWAEMGRTPDTWVSHSGGGGRHVWFGIPPAGPRLPKAVVWDGGGDHSAIERLCERSLIMAPPSIHPRTGRRYTWLDKRHSPFGRSMPAPCPAWVLQLAPVRPVVVEVLAASTGLLRPGRASGPGDVGSTWRDVVERLDVAALVRTWGVRTTGRVTDKGWIECHAIDRPDKAPSAGINMRTGFYLDQGSGLKLGLFDLGVAMGAYGTAREAYDDLRGR